MKPWWQTIFESPVRHWLILFLVINGFFVMRGGVNPGARFASLCAIVEDHQFAIDHYKDLTTDLARTPDGHFHSIKAPGPIFIALPFFWIIDRVLTHGLENRNDRDEVRMKYRDSFTLPLLSLVLQTIPFIILTALVIAWVRANGASNQALQLTALAMLFGNTAALFMNTFFGHGLAAFFFLGFVYFAARRQIVAAAWFYGWTLLCDIGAAVLIVPVLAAFLPQRPHESWRENIVGVLIGAGLPALLWMGYHAVCFGSPFALGYKFLYLPDFADSVRRDVPNLWGVLAILPQGHFLYQLTVGPVRGILWTQPWVFIALAWATIHIYRGRKHSAEESLALARLVVPCFLLLLYMNAACATWRTGGSPGPRYLSMVFPAIAAYSGLIYDRTKVFFRSTTAIGILSSVIFYPLVMSTTILAPVSPLWPYYLSAVQSSRRRLIAQVALFAFAAAWGYGRENIRKEFSLRGKLASEGR